MGKKYTILWIQKLLNDNRQTIDDILTKKVNVFSVYHTLWKKLCNWKLGIKNPLSINKLKIFPKWMLIGE